MDESRSPRISASIPRWTSRDLTVTSMSLTGLGAMALVALHGDLIPARRAREGSTTWDPGWRVLSLRFFSDRGFGRHSWGLAGRAGSDPSHPEALPFSPEAQCQNRRVGLV